MKEKHDLRVIKTKKNIYEALISLLKDKPFEEIKVSDICDKAMINRSTFYAHYSDKYELFAALIEDLRMELAKQLSKNDKIKSYKEYYMEMLKLFLNHIEEEKEIYSAIMIHNKNSIIMDMIFDTLNNDIQKRIEENDAVIHKIPTDIVTKFYIGAVYNVGIEWLKNKTKYTQIDVIHYLEQLIPDNL